MSHVHVSPRRVSGRTLLATVIISLVPLGTAFAQSHPRVRVADEEVPVTLSRRDDALRITAAPAGSVLEVIHAKGDPYVHRDGNWYLVLLPPDAWGRRHIGWVSGRDVDALLPPEPKPAPAAPARPAPVAAPAPRPVVDRPEPAVVTPVMTVAKAPVMQEVVVHFAFDKSDLSDEARTTLNGAVETLGADGPAVSFVLEGHTDWTGSEAYNEKLGLARAENVKRYLEEQHQIAADRISVVSYGETMPSASNDTREGRAENRRVVVKVG